MSKYDKKYIGPHSIIFCNNFVIIYHVNAVNKLNHVFTNISPVEFVFIC
jgi:hypothetical protein